MEQEDRRGSQRHAGMEAQRRGLPRLADADADWREGWHLSAGAGAYLEGLPYDDRRHPDWQDGWQSGELYKCA